MVNIKTKILLVAISILLLQSCDNVCVKNRNAALPLEFQIKIMKMQQQQRIKLEGINIYSKQLEKFENFDFWAVYDSIQIGDTLIKYKGSTDLILKKPNRQDSLVFEMYCGDQPMWKYE